MGALLEREGDLLAAVEPAIGHGCNTRGVMGAGVAAGVRRRWPELYAAYRDRCRRGQLVPGGVFAYPTGGHPVELVYNLATQDRPGPHARLAWVEASVAAMLEHAARHGVDRVALPRIGAGLGGLDWTRVRATLEQLAAASPVTLVVYRLPPARGQALGPGDRGDR